MSKGFEGHKVLSEFWHDRGGRRRINSGDPKIHEYAISGCFLGLCLICAALAGLSKSSNFVMTLMVGEKLLKIRLSSHPVVAVMIEACEIQSPSACMLDPLYMHDRPPCMHDRPPSACMLDPPSVYCSYWAIQSCRPTI